MKPVQRGVIGTMGACAAALFVMAVFYPPAGETRVPRARFAPVLQTEAGGFGSPGHMIGLTLPGRPLTVSSLSDDYPGMAYDLDLVGSGNAEVPRLFLASLPSHLDKLSEVKARKLVFFKVVLPLVLYANEEIFTDRERLWRVRYQVRRGIRPGPLDRLWLIIKAEEYRVAPGDLDELARRLDIVPPSLALALAAMETGWGTSALVRQRNALFGRLATAQAEAVTSGGLTVGLTHEAWNFDNLLESVRAYFRNLNVHPNYQQFRRSRAEMRSAGTPVDGVLLAPYLKTVTERGNEYVDSIRTIIEANELRQLDDARLQFAPAIADPSA
jgi:Bax protein